MKILKKIFILFLICTQTLSLGGCSDKYQKFRFEFSDTFDTDTFVVGYAKNEAEFNKYAEIIYSKMKELHRQYDIYNEYDGINNLCTVNKNAGISPVKVEREITDLLLLTKEAYSLTDKAVNAAMGSVLTIWKSHRDYGLLNPNDASVPEIETLREAAKNTNIEDIIIDEANSTVFISNAETSLDVGAIAKAYAADKAALAAKEAGMVSAIISAGGSVTAVGLPLDGARSSWSIGVQDPDLGVGNVQNIIDTVYFNDATVSCSGGYQRFYTVGGQTYNHIINPETLMPSDKYKQVAVIHKQAYLADVLSTALFILPYEEGAELARKHGASVLWIDSENVWKYNDGYKAVSKTLGAVLPEK
ncbi:MAG: FAD:protein FMN transferase [Clostridiales bacterium]|nr:FAD:protein FMN transferase [Clostridiales bacterium]